MSGKDHPWRNPPWHPAANLHLCAAQPEPGDPTGCPLCGSDEYSTEPGPDGQPDYENGIKSCEECGEQWV